MWHVHLQRQDPEDESTMIPHKADFYVIQQECQIQKLNLRFL